MTMYTHKEFSSAQSILELFCNWKKNFGAKTDIEKVNIERVNSLSHNFGFGNKMSGFKIRSSSNPDVVLVDLAHLQLSEDDCIQLSRVVRNGREDVISRDIMIANERAKVSAMEQSLTRHLAMSFAEMCRLKFELKHTKRLYAELVATVEDMEAGKDDLVKTLDGLEADNLELEQTLQGKEKELAGSKRKYAEMETEMEERRHESEDEILRRQDTIDFLYEKNDVLESKCEFMEWTLANTEKELKALHEEMNLKSNTNQCVIS